MTDISLKLIKELREKTQVGMMDCKKALEEANGDIEKAIEVLRKKGSAVAAKRAKHETNHGRIGGYITDDFSVGTLVEIQTETDFAANTDSLKEFAQIIAKQITKENTTCISGEAPSCLLNQRIETKNITVQDYLNDLVSKIAENIKITKFVRLETTNGVIQNYIHPGSTLSALIMLETEKEVDVETKKRIANLGREICMQIAVTNPISISPKDLDPTLLQKEQVIIREQLKNSGKPENIVDKIMVGKTNKYYSEVCLLNQAFIKDDKITVQKHIEKLEKEIGTKISVIKFERFAIGKK